jgi:hypothetical protein
MSRHDSRARAERVVLLRAVLRKPWREIMRTENFKSASAVQQTYKREMARRGQRRRQQLAGEFVPRTQVGGVGHPPPGLRAGDAQARGQHRE